MVAVESFGWRGELDNVFANGLRAVGIHDVQHLTGMAKSAFAEAETAITEAVVKGDDISFVENLNYQGMMLKITYKGKISGDEIKFTRNMADIADEPFLAKRSKDTPEKK